MLQASSCVSRRIAVPYSGVGLTIHVDQGSAEPGRLCQPNLFYLNCGTGFSEFLLDGFRLILVDALFDGFGGTLN